MESEEENSLANVVKLAESNLKKEIKEAKMKRNSQLVAIVDTSGSSKKLSEGESRTLSSMESSIAEGTSHASSFMKLDDIEMPSSFDSSIGLEKMLCISSEASPSASVYGSKRNPRARKNRKRELASKESSGDTGLQTSNSMFTSSIDEIGFSLAEAGNMSNLADMTSLADMTNLADMTATALFSGAEKVLQALEGSEEACNSSYMKLSVIDLENFSDTLFMATPKSKIIHDCILEDVTEGPHISTPLEDKTNLSLELEPSNKPKITEFDLSFDKNINKKEGTFVLNEEKISTRPTPFNSTFDTKDLNKALVGSELVFNSTFNKGETPKKSANKPVNDTFSTIPTKQPVLNSTFDKIEPRKQANVEPELDLNATFERILERNVGNGVLNSTFDKEEDNLNKTFEVVGNGSFIIEGKCTNLMDMETNDLKTVLFATPIKKTSDTQAQSTPVMHLKQSDKVPIKSSLLKRLSLVGLNSKEAFGSGEKKEEGCHSQQKDGIQGDSLEMRKAGPLNNNAPLTKEEALVRLRKNTNIASSIATGSSCAPLRAIPLSKMGQENVKWQPKKVENLIKRRATSTPVTLAGRGKCIENEELREAKESDVKVGKGPSLPSFGSVSSIDTECPNSREMDRDTCVYTPDVFRTRGKIEGPRITSTPALLHSKNFGTDLGFGIAATPIAPPSSNEGLGTLRLSNNSEKQMQGVHRLRFSQDSSRNEIGSPQENLNQSPVSNEKSDPQICEFPKDNHDNDNFKDTDSFIIENDILKVEIDMVSPEIDILKVEADIPKIETKTVGPECNFSNVAQNNTFKSQSHTSKDQRDNYKAQNELSMVKSDTTMVRSDNCKAQSDISITIRDTEREKANKDVEENEVVIENVEEMRDDEDLPVDQSVKQLTVIENAVKIPITVCVPKEDSNKTQDLTSIVEQKIQEHNIRSISESKFSHQLKNSNCVKTAKKNAVNTRLSAKVHINNVTRETAGNNVTRETAGNNVAKETAGNNVAGHTAGNSVTRETAGNNVAIDIAGNTAKSRPSSSSNSKENSQLKHNKKASLPTKGINSLPTSKMNCIPSKKIGTTARTNPLGRPVLKPINTAKQPPKLTSREPIESTSTGNVTSKLPGVNKASARRSFMPKPTLQNPGASTKTLKPYLKRKSISLVTGTGNTKPGSVNRSGGTLRDSNTLKSSKLSSDKENIKQVSKVQGTATGKIKPPLKNGTGTGIPIPRSQIRK